MGYEAYTTIEVIYGDNVLDTDNYNHPQFLEAFKQQTGAELDWINENSCKWYSDFEDMEQISSKFPDSVFEVHRIGEDSEQWKIIAFNGKAQRIEGVVVFNTPNWTQLGVTQAHPEYLL